MTAGTDRPPGTRGRPADLLNAAEIELWPGGLLRARSSHDARLLSRAIRVLRRKHDGRYLAAILAEGPVALMPGWRREPGAVEALDLLDAQSASRRAADRRHPGTLPLHRVQERLERLGVDPGRYASRTGLALVAEPDRLAFAGYDRYRRPLWLHADAARGWNSLRQAARRAGVVLEAISGYRSHDYQLGIFQRKLARGLALEDILAVNAAPGYSEHHSGLALDIGAPGEPPAEESFEATAAFAWLGSNAHAHGFHMSYPRDNPHGIVYEPWHWRFG